MSDDEHRDSGSAPGASRAVNEGIHHLETAARELIQAGRSFLDALESSLGESTAEDLSSFVSRWADVVRAPDRNEDAEPYTTIDLDLEPDADAAAATETDTDPDGTDR